MIITTLTKSNAKGVTDVERATVNRLIEKLGRHGTKNVWRKELYDQKRVVQSLGIEGREDLRLVRHTLGWCTKAVDSLSALVINEGISIPGVRLADTGLDKYWEQNQLEIESSQAEKSSVLHGIAYLVTTKGGPGEPDAITTPKDSLSGTGEWNTRTRRLDNFLSVLGIDDNGITEMVLYLPGYSLYLLRVGTEWMEQRERSNLPFVPVERLPHNPRTGHEDGSSLITMAAIYHQEAGIRALVRGEQGAQEFIDPVRALLNADMSQFKNEDGTFNEAYYALRNSRTIALEPNVIDILNPDGTDGEAIAPQSFQMIPGLDMTPHITHFEQAANNFAAEIGMASNEYGVRGVAQPVSAEALNAGRNPLILRAEAAARGFKYAYSRSAKTAYMIMNNTNELPPEIDRLTVNYRDPNRASRAAMADATAKEAAAGAYAPRSIVKLRRMGLTADEIEEVQAEWDMAEAAGYLDALNGVNVNGTGN